MIKHFCDECGKELNAEELRFSLDMIGKELCSKHSAPLVDRGKKTTYVKKNEPLEFPKYRFPSIFEKSDNGE